MLPSKFRIYLRPINEDDAEEAVRLTEQSGHCHLLQCDANQVARSAAENQGAVVLDDLGQVIGVCLYKRFRLPMPPGVTRQETFVEFLYIFNLVIDVEFQGLGIGSRVGEATVAFAYAASEGIFPPVVAGAFQDSPRSWKAQEKAGMTCYRQNGFELECDPVLSVIDRSIHEEKQSLGIARPHSIQALDAYRLVTIGRWMTRAYAVWVDATDIEMRVLDPSDGRSGFRRALRDLGRGNWKAIERLNLAKQNDPNMTVFKTAGHRFAAHEVVEPVRIGMKQR